MANYSLNALTIDVEDWYHVCGLPKEADTQPKEFRVRQNTEKILLLLSEHGIKATFFVLGQIAAQSPDIVRMIVDQGHEIASHGYSHKLVTSLSAVNFRDEIRRTDDILGNISGIKPVGFRAPQWSLSIRETRWAFDILAEEGYLYDSSLNPLLFVGDRHGERAPFTVATSFNPILEMPPMVASLSSLRLPTSGGWGLRFFPLSLIRNNIRAYNQQNMPAVIYLHPREVDPEGPRLKLPPLKSYAAYGSRTDVTPRLRALFEEFSFTTMKALASV